MVQKLSAIIITLNEEHALPRCLASLGFADEIIVIDSGSTDRTVEIAEDFGARVINQDWLGYGKQKQFGVDQALNDWVYCIDADEWISDQLGKSIECALQKSSYQAYESTRCNKFLGRWLKHGEGYPDKSLRLFNRKYAQWSEDKVHEKVVTDLEVGYLDGDLMHESEEGLLDYLEKQNGYTSLQACEMKKKGQKVSIVKMFISPLWRFVRFFLIKSGWRDGLPGVIHILIGCQNTFLKQAKLFESMNK